MNRIKNINPRCLDCGSSPEQLHKLGCSFEVCPCCGHTLIHCKCLPLSLEESMWAVAYIARDMDIQEAAKAKRKEHSKTLYDAAVLARQITWTFQNGRPAAKKRIQECLDSGAIIDMGPVLVMVGLPRKQASQPADIDGAAA